MSYQSASYAAVLGTQFRRYLATRERLASATDASTDCAQRSLIKTQAIGESYYILIYYRSKPLVC